MSLKLKADKLFLQLSACIDTVANMAAIALKLPKQVLKRPKLVAIARSQSRKVNLKDLLNYVWCELGHY